AWASPSLLIAELMTNCHDGYKDGSAHRYCQPACRLVSEGMMQPPRGPTVGLVPGFPDDLCLGFANTRYYRGTDPPTETIADLDALLAWCRASSGLSAGGERLLRRAWQQDVTAQACRHPIPLRQTIYPLFFSTAAASI